MNKASVSLEKQLFIATPNLITSSLILEVIWAISFTKVNSRLRGAHLANYLIIKVTKNGQLMFSAALLSFVI